MHKIFHGKKLNRKDKDSVTLSLFCFTAPLASVPWGPFRGGDEAFLYEFLLQGHTSEPRSERPPPHPVPELSFLLSLFSFFAVFLFSVLLLTVALLPKRPLPFYSSSPPPQAASSLQCLIYSSGSVVCMHLQMNEVPLYMHSGNGRCLC